MSFPHRTNNNKLVVAKSFEEAIHLSYELYKKGLIGRVCVLGGQAIYQVRRGMGGGVSGGTNG